MESTEEKLEKLKRLFSQFEAVVKDITVPCDTSTSSCNFGQEVVLGARYVNGDSCCSGISSDGNKDNARNKSEDFNALIPNLEDEYNTERILRSIVFHHQKTQETLAYRRAEATPTLTDDLIEISWIEDIGSVPISQRSSGAVITTVQIDNSECCKSELVRCQHQKIQETQGTHRDDHSIGLSRTDDIDLNAATLPISEANTVAVENMSGQSGTSRLEHDKVGTPAENEQHNFVKANMSEETDDYDEEVFQSCMESDDLEIVDYSSGGQINLPSIIETLAERTSHDINLLSNNECAERCKSSPAESANRLDLSTIRLIGSSDNTKMFVQTSDQKGKKLCCPFCWKLVCKLSRHVTTIHKDEEQVQKLVAIPQGGEFNKERWNIQNAIQTAGLLRWNTDRTINTSGILIVPRRPHPSLNRMATDFLICPNCTSFHSITNLRNHFTRCTNGKMKGTRNIKILARAVEGRLSNEASEQLKEVIPVMKEDEIVRLIRYDWLLIAYGNILCMKYSFHFQQNMIRAKLRLAGRVLHAFKKINPEVTNFASIFYPKHYKTLIEAINAVGKFNPATNEFGAPATSASAITSVKQIGSVLKCEYIQREKSEHVKRTDDFLFLMESQYTSIINKRVKESQLVKKRMKDHKIPSNEDVRLFSLYVNREREKYLKELSANYSLKNWVKLSELTIASIIVFNRRRTGESQNIHVCDFNHCESVNETSNEALFTSLSEKAKEVVRLFSRMKVRGKKGVINVSVLLQADVTSCIKLLLSHRLEAGIPSHNPYLFALPSPPGEKRIRVINSCKVLATLSTLCGAKDPSTLRGTNLRKHFATACMAKELNDDMVGEVAKFMGHRESVHRENYRHNTVDREIVKIVELLLAAQGNVQDEDDVSDSDSDSESEDITMLNPALRVVPKKRGSANKNKIAVTPSSLKRKVNEKVQPRKLLVNGSKSARQIGQKRMGSEGGEKAGGKRIKKEGKERSTKNSVGSAISALSARQKCMRTEGAKQPEKSVRKRVKVKGKERPEKKSGAGRKINTNTSFQISTTDKSSANH